MKQVITAIFAFVALTLAAGAQTKQGKHHHRQKVKLAQQLHLTAEQKTALKKQHTDTKAQLLALEKREGITLTEYREKKSRLKQMQKEKMLALLTPEQTNKLTALKAQKKTLHQQRQEQRLAVIKEKIQLTDGQIAAVKSRREASRLTIRQLKENQQLSRLEKKEKILALKKKDKEAFTAALTPEQKSRWEELKKNKRSKAAK